MDLYLIHWPIGYGKSTEFFPKTESGERLSSNFDLMDTWRAMEKLVDDGLTKSIGISNFNIRQVNYIYDNARIKPVVNQVEVHPYLLNTKLREHCKSKNIVITAYSPLGSPGDNCYNHSFVKYKFNFSCLFDCRPPMGNC